MLIKDEKKNKKIHIFISLQNKLKKLPPNKRFTNKIHPNLNRSQHRIKNRNNNPKPTSHVSTYQRLASGAASHRRGARGRPGEGAGRGRRRRSDAQNSDSLYCTEGAKLSPFYRRLDAIDTASRRPLWARAPPRSGPAAASDCGSPARSFVQIFAFFFF